jgi:hypothetical protein
MKSVRDRIRTIERGAPRDKQFPSVQFTDNKDSFAEFRVDAAVSNVLEYFWSMSTYALPGIGATMLDSGGSKGGPGQCRKAMVNLPHGGLTLFYDAADDTRDACLHYWEFRDASDMFRVYNSGPKVQVQVSDSRVIDIGSFDYVYGSDTDRRRCRQNKNSNILRCLKQSTS